jgi:translation initiation factor IF-3
MRLAEDVAELGTIEQSPQQDGRNMTMLLAPTKRKPDQEADPAEPADEAPPAAETPAAPPAPAEAESA